MSSQYTLTKKLFITISPPDRSYKYAQLGLSNPNQAIFYDDNDYIKHIFKRYRIKKYIMYPEFDEKGRLHYHGRATLTPSQEVSFYKSIKPYLQRNIGFVDVSVVKHDLENLLYCMCEWGKTSKILDIKTPTCPLYAVPVRELARYDKPHIANLLDYFKFAKEQKLI